MSFRCAVIRKIKTENSNCGNLPSISSWLDCICSYRKRRRLEVFNTQFDSEQSEFMNSTENREHNFKWYYQSDIKIRNR